MAQSGVYFKVLVFFFFSLSIYGQQITGKILDDKSKEPLENVSVFLSKTKEIGTTSDEFGSFNLRINSKLSASDSVSFSMVGYKTYQTTLSALKGKNNTIFLSSTLSELNQVNVTKEKKRSNLKFNKVTSLKYQMHAFASIMIDQKLYISGGDMSIEEDAFSIALEKASMASMELTLGDILSKWQPSGAYKGYSDKLLIYDLEEDSWETSHIKFENRAYHQINYYNNELYILGGKKFSGLNSDEYLHNTIEIYDIVNQNVQIDRTNPHQAINFASFVYKDNIITMGGAIRLDKNGDKVYSDKIHQFNLKNGLWYEMGTLKSGMEVKGTLIGDKFYTIGGLNTKTSSIESWNINTGEWIVDGELFYGFDEPALASLGTNIYIYHYGKILVYNVEQKSLKEYGVELYLQDSKMHIYNDVLYLIGGYKETKHTKYPISGVYSIDLSEFQKTTILNFKYL